MACNNHMDNDPTKDYFGYVYHNGSFERVRYRHEQHGYIKYHCEDAWHWVPKTNLVNV